VLLHVGTPKSGTTYLQDVLFRNRKVLARADILYPANRFDAHFLAALDLMSLTWAGLEAEAIGAWGRLAEQVREHQHTSIISHEILARASRSQISRALSSLGHDEGTEIHVVLSVRDLVRQIPAEWQENVKHRSGISYKAFLDQIRAPNRESRIATWFWGVQEVPDILARWGHDLPPKHIHLVTVPPAGVAPELLWSRFSHVFGLDALDLDLQPDRVNPSLGVPEIALIRRINRAVTPVLAPAHYRPLVRELLAHRTLSQRRSSPRLELPVDSYPWVRDLEQSWVDEIAQRGYDVVGDLAELIGAPPAEWTDPERPPEKAVAGAAVEAITALLLDNARLRHEQERLNAELSETQVALERSYVWPSYQLRRRLLRRLTLSAVGRAVLRVIGVGVNS